MAEEASGAEAQEVIFDTDVLIWYFRGSDRARRFLARVPRAQRGLSALSIMELVQGCRDPGEVRRVKLFVSDNLPNIRYPDEPVSRRAIGLLEQYARPHGLRVVDALIAATALEAGAALASANVKQYRAIAQLPVILFTPHT